MAAATVSASASTPSPPSLPPELSALITPLTLRLRDVQSFQLPRISASSSSPSPSLQQAQASFASYEGELNDALDDCKRFLREGDVILQEVRDDMGSVDQVVEVEWARIKAQYASARSSARQVLLSARRALADGKARRVRPAPAAKSADNGADDATSLSPPSYKPLNGGLQPPRSSTNKQPTSTSSSYDPDTASAAQHSSQLTTSLQSTLETLSHSLVQSSHSLTLLDESSQSLADLGLDYASFTLVMANSAKILKGMKARDRIDVAMLALAYLFFFACVGYVLKVRIWDRGAAVVAILLRAVGLLGRADTRGATAASAVTASVVEAAKSKSAEAAAAAAAASTSSLIAAASSSSAAAAAAAASSAAAAAAASSAASSSSSSASLSAASKASQEAAAQASSAEAERAAQSSSAAAEEAARAAQSSSAAAAEASRSAEAEAEAEAAAAAAASLAPTTSTPLAEAVDDVMRSFMAEEPPHQADVETDEQGHDNELNDEDLDWEGEGGEDEGAAPPQQHHDEL